MFDLDTHNPINGFHDGVHDFLSNFFAAAVEYNGIKFPTAEHAYQSQKSGNNKVHRIFAKLETPQDAKILGRAIIARPDWDGIKDLVMYNVVYAKFNQNPELVVKLLKTGDRDIVELNYWKDTYWGVCNGVGENKLGKILMQLRDHFRCEYKA